MEEGLEKKIHLFLGGVGQGSLFSFFENYAIHILLNCQRFPFSLQDMVSAMLTLQFFNSPGASTQMARQSEALCPARVICTLTLSIYLSATLYAKEVQEKKICAPLFQWSFIYKWVGEVVYG